MKYISKVLGWLLWMVNMLFVLAMLFCAYSPHIDPIRHPVLACAGLAFPVMLVVNLLFLLFWLVIYRRYALLSFVSMLCCYQSVWLCIPLNLLQEEVPEKCFKILSYNVMAFNQVQANTENGNEIVNYLKQSNADIICIQEFAVGGSVSQKAFDEALSDYPYNYQYQPICGWNRLACYSRYPILSATPVSYKSEGNGSIAYTIKVGNDTITVINNHLESNKLTADDRAVYVDMIKDPEADKAKKVSRQLLSKLADAVPLRAVQADSLVKVIQERKTQSIVVCGDFNTSPFSYTHRVIRKELKDAFSQSGKGLGISYNKNGFYFRIDHILISDDLMSHYCTVDRSISYSDHYPIWCYISKK